MCRKGLKSLHYSVGTEKRTNNGPEAHTCRQSAGIVMRPTFLGNWGKEGNHNEESCHVQTYSIYVIIVLAG